MFFLLLLTSKVTSAKTFREHSEFLPLTQAIELNETERAWQLVKMLEADHLGDVDFDFLYGLVALKAQENERAVYAFERVVANKPKWLDAQYYLASAYYAMKNYHAVIEITQSLSQIDNIPLKLKQSAEKLNHKATAALNKQSLYVQQSVDINLGYDSNINAGTREDNIFLPFLNQDIALSEKSKENSDSYLALGYQLMSSKALTQSSKVTFSATGKLHHFNNDTEYNRFSVRSHLQYKKDFSAFSSSIGVRVVPLWLNDSYYRTRYGVTAGLNKALNTQWLVAIDGFLGATKNDLNSQLNTEDVSLQISTQYVMSNWRHALSLAYAQEDAELVESQHNNKKITSINYMVNFAINPFWLASANISYQHQAYQYEQPFFFEKRVDDMWLFSSSIQYQATKRWSYRLSAIIQEKDSNLDLFSYQRADINLSARMSF